MIEVFQGHAPRVAERVYVAPQAAVIGRVTLAEAASVWPGAVLRGDLNDIVIGAYTNLQEHVVGHVENDLPLVVGDYVTVGHGAILHACHIGSGALIGMGAIVLNGAEVGEAALLGAGALLPPGKKIPPGMMAVGSPAKVVRALTQEEIAQQRRWAEEYAALAARFAPPK